MAAMAGGLPSWDGESREVLTVLLQVARDSCPATWPGSGWSKPCRITV